MAEVVWQGTRFAETGRLAAAQELLEKAASRFPGQPDLAFELGMVYFRRRNRQKAAENYKRSLGLKPGRVKPLFYLAECYYMESDPDRARETIWEAARIAPNDPQICQKYGQYLILDGRTRAEGLSWLEKARRLSPGLARIDFEIGRAQLELGDFRSAVSSFEAAFRTNSGDGQAAFFEAESSARMNEWERARQYYEFAVERGYANGPAYFGLGRSFLELGKPEPALRPLRRAAALQPSLIHAHFQLANAYRQLGRTEEARRETRLFGAMTNRIDTSRELKGPEEESGPGGG